MKIFFWDIDGTLIRTSKAGLYAFKQAAEEMWGKSVDFTSVETAGMTDNFIAKQIIKAILNRAATLPEIEQLCRRYESLLQEQLTQRTGIVLPEVRNILARMGQHDDYKQLLLTGNSIRGAQTKLRHFELDRYFDFNLSAFSRQHEKRVDIAKSALEMVRENWGEPDAHAIYVIGDTPHDIECGKAIGAWTIGVATGTYSLSELKECSPWWVVETLPTPEEFIAKIERS